MSTISIPTATEHVVQWCRIEEEDYASMDKFGYRRLLTYLRQGGAEPGSVWESQLTRYWRPAVVLDQQLRERGADTIAARQQFAKHTNAARALLSAMLTRLHDNDYEAGKNRTYDIMRQNGQRLEAAGLPFLNSRNFDPTSFFDVQLRPIFERIRAGLHGDATLDHGWDAEAMLGSEPARFSATIAPVTDYLLASFGVTVAYVVADGPLPRPAVPSGEIHVWACQASILNA